MEKSWKLKVVASLAAPALFGCSSSPGFELEPATALMPEKWINSVESVPYLPTIPTVLKESETSTSTPASAAPAAPVVTSPARDLAYGVPVPGKKGLVRSPWSDQGFVDVSGMPPGVEARCPYSGKVFLVP